MSRILALSLCLLALAGCEVVSTPDGRIPTAYLDRAKAVQQTVVLKSSGYGHGDVTPGKTTLRLSLEGDRAVLESSDDLIGAGCGTKIGALYSIVASDEGISWADFRLDPGKCARRLTGRSISVAFEKEGARIRLTETRIRRGRRFQIVYHWQ